MKDEMPLTAEDFAAIRKGVMSALEARRSRRNRTFRAIQLAFAAILIIIGAQWLTRKETVAPLPRPPLRRRQPPLWSAAAPAAAVKAVADATALQSKHHHRRAARTHHAPVVAAANDTPPMRIELATADPDVRIIWISSPTGSR